MNIAPTSHLTRLGHQNLSRGDKICKNPPRNPIVPVRRRVVDSMERQNYGTWVHLIKALIREWGWWNFIYSFTRHFHPPMAIRHVRNRWDWLGLAVPRKYVLPATISGKGEEVLCRFSIVDILGSIALFIFNFLHEGHIPKLPFKWPIPYNTINWFWTRSVMELKHRYQYQIMNIRSYNFHSNRFYKALPLLCQIEEQQKLTTKTLQHYNATSPWVL